MMIRTALKWSVAIIAFALLILFAWGYEPDIPVEVLKTKYANMESEFVDLGDGLVVHLRDEGPVDAPAIILLHGSSASLHTWDEWTERLKGQYRIIRYDQPGHGLTGPHPGDCYSLTCFNDVVSRVARNRDLDRFYLGGNSMGGAIAYSFARNHPEQLKGLILVDASGAPDAKPKKLPIGFRIMQMPMINKLATIITPRSLVEKSLRGSVSKGGYIDDAEINLYWELLRRDGNRDATIKRFSQRGEKSWNNRGAALLDVPTLILWGEEDRLVPVSSVKWFEDVLPNHRTHIYNGTGHIPMQEVAEESARDMQDWLESVVLVKTKTSDRGKSISNGKI